MGGYGNVNSYFQINVKNQSSGINASSDIVATADDGTESSNYIDLGINSSNFIDNTYDITKAHDGYVYVDGGDLVIGARTAGKVIKLHAGGATAGDEKIRITSADTIISNNLIATGSFQGFFDGTSSYTVNSDSSSYSINSDTSSYIIGINVTGSVNSSLTSSFIVPGATFYLVSGSNGYNPAYIEPYDYCPTTSLYRPPFKEGRMMWDHKYVDYSHYMDTNWRLHLGKEVTIGVRNPYPFTLTRLSAVYISGSTNDPNIYQPNVYLAQADGTGTKSKVLGVIRNDIPSGSTGFCLMNGIMHRTDMGTYQVGDELWLSETTPGGLTTTKPGQPYEAVSVGYCSEAGSVGSFICSINIEPLPSSAYAGITSDILIFNNNDGTIGISTGSVNLFSNSSGLGNVTSYLLSETTLSLITGSTNYIVAELTGSNLAHYYLTTDNTYANGLNIVNVAIVDIYTAGGTQWDVHSFNIGITGLALANRSNNKDIRLYGYQRENGLTLYITGSNGNFGITEGNVWYGANSFPVTAFDTTLPGYYTYHFETTSSNGTSSWDQHTSSFFVSGMYNSGSYGLVPCAPLSWSVNFIYRLLGTTDEAGVVVSNNQYATELEASDNATTPPDLPPTIANLGLLVGRLIVQSGSYSPTVESAFSNIFIPSTVTNHENLIGLQGGQGGEHYHLTSTEYIGTGDGVFMRQNNPTASNIMYSTATPYHVPYWSIDKTLTYTGSVQVYQGQYVLINSSSFFDPNNPEALLVKQLNTSSFNLMGGYGNTNNYFQINVHNFNTGSFASSDIVATADIGAELSKYVNMGIASSTYNYPPWTIITPTDAYLINEGGHLIIGTQTSGKRIKFFTDGPSADSSSVYIDSSGLHASGSISSASVSISSSYSNLSLTASYISGGPYRISSFYPTSSTDVSNKQYVDDSLTPINNSVFSLEYVFKTSTISGDPGAGNFKYNSSTTGSITNIWIDNITNNGLDITNILTSLNGNVKLYIQQRNNSNKSLLFSLSGSVINNSGWFTIPVSYESSGNGGLPDANNVCILIVLNQNSIISGSTYQITSSWSNNSLTASYVASSNISGIINSTNASYATQSLFSTQSLYSTQSIYTISASWVSASVKITASDTASYVTASNVVGTVTSASYAITASYIGMPIKAGIVTSQSFSTGNPRTASIVFTKPFIDNNYSVVVTGDSARTWLIQNKVSGSFKISSNAATPITGSTYWQAIYQGEYN